MMKHSEVVANFKMKFVGRTRDKNIHVQMVNLHGDMVTETLPRQYLFRAEKFREWCLSKGNFVWYGGNLELQSLRVALRVES